LLCFNYILAYEKSIKVFHNRWIGPKEFRRLNINYNLGESACYGFFFFHGKKFARRLVLLGLNKDLLRSAKSFLPIILLQWSRKSVGTFYWNVISLLARFYGLGIGLYYSRKELLIRPQ
jgi:hypothetical protein